MMKNETRSFQILQVASDVINLRIISVKIALIIKKNTEMTNDYLIMFSLTNKVRYEIDKWIIKES